MITITAVSPSQLVVVGPGLSEWRQKYRQRPDGYFIVKAYRKGFWDGYNYPGSRMEVHPDGFRLFIGRGWLSKLLADLPGAQYVEGHLFKRPPLNLSGLDLSGLRDYQSTSLDLISQAGWGRIALATNAGKGAVIALAAQGAVRAGLRVLILADEVSPYQALAEEMGKWGLNHFDQVIAGVKSAPSKPVVLAMVPTLARRLSDPLWVKQLAQTGMVLLDEADRAGSRTWQSVLEAAGNSVYRVGFSGSFEQEMTEPGLVIEDSIGPVITSVRNIELIERGISAKPEVELYAYSHPVQADRREDWGDMDPQQRREWIFQRYIITNLERHRFVASLLDPAGYNVVVVNRIDHGELLQQMIPGSVYLNGRTKATPRKRALEAFRRGEIRVLIVTRIMDRGSNYLGKTTHLIFAGVEGSWRQILQRMGRGLRKVEDKHNLVIRDVIDRGHPYLNHLARRRVQIYHSEKLHVVIAKQTPEASLATSLGVGEAAQSFRS